jgi:lambda family phage tail tape measure protein
MGFQVGLIGMTEDQVELETNLRQEAERYQDVVENLKNKQQELRNNMIGEKDAEKVKLYGAEIGQIEKTIKLVSDQHQKNRDIIDKQTNAIQGARMVEQARKQDIENTTKAIEDQISRQQQLGDILRGINNQQVELKFQSTLKGKSPLERQILEIRETARKGALEAGRTFSETFNSEDGLTAEKANELANGLNQIANAYIGIANAQISALGVSKEFADGQLTAIQAIQEQIRSGLTVAWDEYKTKAIDTAGQIKSSFENFTSGLEDAFVQFVQTGKLSFKDLANSILADLARIAVKKAIVGMASLFGFAAGGQVMADTPIIVGERGPEMFVPRSAGTIVPNNALGGMASGSNQPSQSMVTYNIQAVDAASFRSLVARDPSFIYAVTEQGRRSQPTRSR